MPALPKLNPVENVDRRKRRRLATEATLASDDVLSLSFLDVLSCGLGAAIYLFLIFSIMPHLGTALGASGGRKISKGSADSAGIKTIQEVVRNSVVSIDVRIADWAREQIFPEDPWNGTLPPRASRSQPVKLPTNTVLFSTRMNGRNIHRTMQLSIDASRLPATGKLQIEVNVFVGGSTASKSWNVDVETIRKSQGRLFESDLLSGDAQKWIMPIESKNE